MQKCGNTGCGACSVYRYSIDIAFILWSDLPGLETPLAYPYLRQLVVVGAQSA